MSRARCLACDVPMHATGTRTSGGFQGQAATFVDVYSCEKCGASVSLRADDVDVRPVKADSRETFDLFVGARYRKFTDAQIEYLAGCVGITWAKAFRAGQKAGPDT